MKQTNEVLSKAQEEAMIYRQKLETGKLRVVRVVPARSDRPQRAGPGVAPGSG
jgi:hypothetical protein